VKQQFQLTSEKWFERIMCHFMHSLWSHFCCRSVLVRRLCMNLKQLC